jgi:aspartate racemase
VRHIGIVAVTAEGAALCYQTIVAEGPSVLGPGVYPEVTLHALPQGAYVALGRRQEWEEVGEMLLRSAETVRRAGADFLICPANTAHIAIDRIRDRTPLPWLHIAEVVGAAAAAQGWRRLLLLGTRTTMEGPIYAAALSGRGIEFEIPDLEDRRRVDDLIFDELIHGRFEERARDYIKGLIAAYRDRGGAAVIHGCTELPLLLPDAASPLPTLDSTRLLARAALREAAA